MLWLALALASVAALIDVRSGRIPNAITYPAIALGLALGLAPGADPGLGARGLGLAVGFGPSFALFLAGVLGGGDVKLLAALGALVGFPAIVEVLLYSGLAGAVIGLGVLVWNGRLAATLHGMAAIAGMASLGQRPPPVPARDLRIPLGAAICTGVAWTLAAPVWGVGLVS